MNEKLSAGDMINSLTGFEEIAIEQHMGTDPYADGERKPMKVMRALVFVQQTRSGMTPQEAKNHALNLSLADVQAAFSDEEDEVMPEEPVTEEGKEDSASE